MLISPIQQEMSLTTKPTPLHRILLYYLCLSPLFLEEIYRNQFSTEVIHSGEKCSSSKSWQQTDKKYEVNIKASTTYLKSRAHTGKKKHSPKYFLSI